MEQVRDICYSRRMYASQACSICDYIQFHPLQIFKAFISFFDVLCVIGVVTYTKNAGSLSSHIDTRARVAVSGLTVNGGGSAHCT